VIEVAMAEEDVADAGGIDAGREQPTNKAEAAAGAEEDDARMRRRVRA
jgi:hypothetical protein